MAKTINPFIVSGRIEPEYFCDRRAESARLVKSVTNGNNLVLISPRRMGKTGLVRFCYDLPEIKDSYYTFFIDILHTSSLREFVYVLEKEIYNTLQPRGERIAEMFLQTLKSIRGKFSLDSVTGQPSFSLELGDIEQPDFLLDDIFSYLEGADKPCIVTIDEFQQVAKYPEKNTEALLRGYIQKSSNCNFIYAGSERHMMQEMFLSVNRPFYQSADMLELKAIPKEAYVPFIVENFRKFGKDLASCCAEEIYNFFSGHTFYIQKVFNEAFTDTAQGQTCTSDTVNTALCSILESYDTTFRERLSTITEKQKGFLYAVAAEGEVSSVTSAAFIKRHKLSSASSVQAAAKKLLEFGLITQTEGVYRVENRFFGLWISAQMLHNRPVQKPSRVL